jgi:hypothetical protein
MLTSSRKQPGVEKTVTVGRFDFSRKFSRKRKCCDVRDNGNLQKNSETSQIFVNSDEFLKEFRIFTKMGKKTFSLDPYLQQEAARRPA